MKQQERINKLTEIADTYGIGPQSDMMIEEMSELTKAILKQRRAEADEKGIWEAINNVVDEIADVQIMLWQIAYLYDKYVGDEIADMIEQRIDQKLDRQIERIRGAIW